ncbi:MAG: O-antigen ligase family protein [Pyrinomonadaceae bacterium]
MSSIINPKDFRQSTPFIFLTLWSLLLLANLVPTIPQPEIIIGYLWKVEFALAAFLFIGIVLFLKLPKEKFVRFTEKEFFFIILPLLLFTIWSGFSVFRAESARNALHHTLLWACYCVFYLLIRQIASRPKFLAASFKVTGMVILILGASCIFEYISNPETISAFFTFRYYKYAEAAVTLLPVFLALTFQTKSRTSVLCGFIAVVAWLIVLLSLSRTLFISGGVCVVAFFALAILFTDFKKHLKKSLLLAGLFIICVFITQINFTGGQDSSTITRFSGNEYSQGTSFDSRFLFWGIALEAFKKSPFAGVGADNYVMAYGLARENFSAKNQENKLLEINEDVLAERAHNEYLQILSELGIVGIIFFLWLLFGIARLFFSSREKPKSLLQVAALAGIVAFLVSSLASSYSFRVPANGLCFFFVLAIAMNSPKSQASSPKSSLLSNLGLETWDLRLPTIAFGLIICASMLVFSAVRGTSLMYLQFALMAEKDESEQYYQKAITLDAQEPSFRYYYGLHLYNLERAEEALPEMRFAINKGFATSITYFNLASAQMISKKPDEAEKTIAEALRIYPRSVFLRTAYAAFLKKAGKDAESQIEYEKALRVNAEQAKSWWIAHTEGMKKLTQTENQDKTLVKVMDLRPSEGIYALLDFQRQFNPNLVRR